jgi:hypothetical protein
MVDARRLARRRDEPASRRPLADRPARGCLRLPARGCPRLPARGCPRLPATACGSGRVRTDAPPRFTRGRRCGTWGAQPARGRWRARLIRQSTSRRWRSRESIKSPATGHQAPEPRRVSPGGVHRRRAGEPFQGSPIRSQSRIDLGGDSCPRGQLTKELDRQRERRCADAAGARRRRARRTDMLDMCSVPCYTRVQEVSREHPGLDRTARPGVALPRHGGDAAERRRRGGRGQGRRPRLGRPLPRVRGAHRPGRRLLLLPRVRVVGLRVRVRRGGRGRRARGGQRRERGCGGAGGRAGPGAGGPRYGQSFV